MKLPPFLLEEFWKKYEFSTPHLFCCSDPESWTVKELLALADPESKQMWETLSLGYTEVPGLPLLREEIATLYSTIGKDQVFTFAGAEEGIYCSMSALVEPGDHVIVIDPSYQSLKTLPSSLGAHISTISLSAENNWQLDLKEVESKFQKNTKLIVLNYPHNPTGSLLSKEVFEGIIHCARKQGAYIFSDEVYRFLEFDETKRLPSIADAYEKGISLNVMTKSFGLAGLRIGWIVSHDTQFIDAVASYKLYTSICNSAPSEILALMALRAKSQILERNRTIIQTNLHLLDSFMDRNRDILSWVRPEGGTFAVIKLLLPLSIETFAQELAKQEGVLIMPGSVLGLPGNYFRIGFGRKNMPEVLSRFEAFLSKNIGDF